MDLKVHKEKKDLHLIGFRKQVKCRHLLQDNQVKIIQDLDNQMDLLHLIKVDQDQKQILLELKVKQTYLEIFGCGKLPSHMI